MAKTLKSRRLHYGSSAVFSTVVFLAILVLVALIAERHPLRADLTESGQFSLSEQSRKVVASIEEPITIKAFFAAGAPEASRAKDLLETYRYHNKNLRYEFIDPDREPQLARQYEIRDYGVLVIEGLGRKETVPRADEEALTNALFKLSRKDDKTVYFLTGHGERSFEDMSKGGYSSARSALVKENNQVKSLNLMQQTEVPQDAAVLIVAGPQKPLFAEEVASLERYLLRGGKVVFFLDPEKDGGVRSLLEKYGIALGDDMIIDKLSRVFGGSYLMPVVTQYGSHKITQGFNVATFYSEARSVTPSDAPPDGVTLVPLASTSENAWAETDLDRLYRGEASFEEGKDKAGPISVGVLAAVNTEKFSFTKPPASEASPGAQESNSEAHDTEKADTSKPTMGYLVVFGDSDFADNTHFGVSGNSDLFLNMVHFLAEEESLISIEPRKQKAQTLMLTATQARVAFWTSMVGVPLIVVLAGFGVYRIRRSQR
ncbi:MAG: GldG family protein [Desulfosoma sp.]|uniref:GldG family protein n=1 Tax=Desulfosoma sp. TaxID=2603217 RepID=UPI00404947E9